MADPIDTPSRCEGADPAPAQITNLTDPPATQLCDRVSHLVVEDIDRAESPTDAVMPLMRRAAGSNGPNSSLTNEMASPSAYIDAQAAPDPRTQSTSTAESRTSAPTPEEPSVMASNFSFTFEAAQSLPTAPLRISPELRTMTVGPVYDNDDELTNEIDIRANKACRWMEGVCHISADKDPSKVDWRKAMSHIFGRNKNCTRSIPEDVWLFMCRKHYQRGRYRNNHEYNVKLTKLVISQVLRLEAWSNNNQDLETPENGVITDYTLAPRRREQLRLQNKKRKASESADGDSDSEDDSDGPGPEEATMPTWLEQACGTGKTAVEIVDVLLRILNALTNDRMMRFPDIEILPTITGERAKPNNKRAKSRRNPADPKPAPAQQAGQRGRRRQSAAGSNAPTTGSQLTYRPNPNLQPSAPLADERYAYSNQLPRPVYPVANTWAGAVPQGPAPQDFTRGHRPTRSWGGGAYDQPQFGYPTTYNPATTETYSSYSQYPVTGRDPARSGGFMTNGYAQNGYWDPNYDARQRQQQAQQAQTTTGFSNNTGYGYPPPATTSTGAPLGGPPPAHVAKHTKSLSMPASFMMARGSRPHSPMPSAAMAPSASTSSSMMYGQSDSRYQYGGSNGISTAVGPANSTDSVPRAAEYTDPRTTGYTDPHLTDPRFAGPPYGSTQNAAHGQGTGSAAEPYDPYQAAPRR
ncbi:hypothetical protein VTJ49DRAFT_427 [Mycothermus thermophilus]|uniref:Uncharacterized protein n=1 Tax=Humicola insolens TaxID=85995 RepID=A0ABR3VFV2_HUMIN